MSMILNQSETFGLLGNRIGLPLLEVDEGTANDLRTGAETRGVIENLALLGASNGRRKASSHIPTPQRR